MSSRPTIAIIPYRAYPNFGLSKMNLNDLHWPLGRPSRLNSGTISKMKKTDHLITYPRKSVFLFPRFYVKAQISVVICEPDIIHKKYLKWSQFLNWRFYKILTKSKSLLSKIDNGILFIAGGTFINNFNNLNNKKTKLLSIIASQKKDLEGHKLRHKIINYIQKNKLAGDIIGRGYKPFKNKEEGLSPYHYSVVIENIQETNYFSEKLIDCFLCETIPIYWGAKNILDHFDERGMIICTSEKEIQNELKKISTEIYNSKLEWIKKNRILALNYVNFNDRVAKLINDSLK